MAPPRLSAIALLRGDLPCRAALRPVLPFLSDAGAPFAGSARRLDWLRPTTTTAAHHKEGSRTAEMARLEAVLLVARQPLSTRRLAQLARLADGTQARTLIRRLQICYDTEGTAFRVEEFAGGFQLLTRPKFSGWLRRLGTVGGEGRLSSPALETLAVVAYRQPVVRGEIEAIRGVGCGEILRQLMDRDLVKIVGRAEELGRPFLYGTTKRFLQAYGLRNLDALPRANELRLTSRPATPGDATADIPENDIPEHDIPENIAE